MADFTDLYVDAAGVKTRYWSVGTGGVPLVFLHGLGGTIEDWVGSLRPLSQNRRVIAIDLLGSGHTDKPAGCTYKLDEMSAHIRAVLSALDLDRVILNGWSLGARIALDVAHSDPDRIKRLVLTAPAGIGPETILNLKAPLHDILRQIATRPTASGARLIDNVWHSDSALRLLQFTGRRLILAADGASRRVFVKQLKSIVGLKGYLEKPRHAVLEKLPDISVPTLAIWGRQDNFAPADHAQVLTDLMPNCTTHFIDDCGHTPHIEWPKAYNSAVRAFVDDPLAPHGSGPATAP